MGMCCFDVTRSLTVAGRLWSKDVNRTKTITADTIGRKVETTLLAVNQKAKQLAGELSAYVSTPRYATLVA